MRQLIPATRNPLPRPEGQTPSGQARGHLGSLSGRLAALTALMAGALALAACGGGPDAKPDAASDPGSAGDQTMAAQDAAQVVVEDNHGSITVPVNPERVVALDNRAFELLSRWDVPLVAAPKSLMGNGLFPKYSGDDSLPDVGTHREPNLEVIAAAEPDLVIGGMRFSSHYDAIKQLDPSVPVIELSPRDGEDLNGEIRREVITLGKIFDRADQAKAAVDEFDEAIAQAKAAYNGEDTVVGLLTSGGKISYVAPGTGRAVGAVFPALGLKPAIQAEADDTSHGDDISVEAIAQAAPEWLIVLDRDGAVGEDGAAAARELISGAEALAQVPAVVKDQVIYLDPDFYLTEDVFAYTELYSGLASAFAATDGTAKS